MQDKPTLYVDVDDTLVSPANWHPVDGMQRDNMVQIGSRWWQVHQLHVEDIKNFGARGHTVVVWSQGGSEWAKEVVETLGLEEWVDLCIAKPSWYIDDKKGAEFLEEHRRIWRYL